MSQRQDSSVEVMDIEPEFWFCLTHLVVEGRGQDL